MQTRPDKQTKIAECPLDELRDELGSLAHEHWLELEDNKKMFKLSIDWPSYYIRQFNNEVVALTVRHHGELVGYSVTLLCVPIHSDAITIGVNSAVFLRREHRGGGLGTRLILATESAAKQHGAKVMSWHAKPATSMAQMMERMGYEVQHITYNRSI
jgi:GNAT superfamily N-acetyltransferase